MIRRRLALLGALSALALAALVLAGPAGAATGPEWKLTIVPDADYFLPGHYGVYRVEAENVGDAPTTNSSKIKLQNFPPAGLTGEQVAFFDTGVLVHVGRAEYRGFGGFGEPNLSPADACLSPELCKWPEGPAAAEMPPIQPGQRLIMVTIFKVAEGLSGKLEDLARVSGGGAATAEASVATLADPAPPLTGVLGFESALTESSGQAYTQAGGHPYQFTTEFHFATVSTSRPVSDGKEAPASYVSGISGHGRATVGGAREIVTELPPGLLANPQGVPHCSLADYFSGACRPEDQIGNFGLQFENHWGALFSELTPAYNLQPSGAYPGEIGIYVAQAPFVLLTATLRTGSDYGVTATASAQELQVSLVRLSLWGVPAASTHTPARFNYCPLLTFNNSFDGADPLQSFCEATAHGEPAGVEETPFLRMPTACTGDQLPATGSYNTYEEPAGFTRRSALFPAVDGCNELSFEPTIEARPTTTLADAPSGLEFHLHIPQDEEPQGVGTPDLHEAVVKLPPGLTVNPSSGNGLAGCSPAQIGLATPVGQTPAHFSEAPAACPEQSAIASAEVQTPLLHNPLRGVVYLATPRQNPFSSLLAAYIVLEGEGLHIKLPGEIEADPQTGQLTGKFLENPQTPFEDFHLDFFGGARGDLRTPATCGTYTTSAVLTPYSAPESGPPAEPNAGFNLENGGAPCPAQASQLPNAPAFRAGTESAEAGKFTPFSFRLAREDGSQELSKIETTLPPGLTGKLAGVAECSEARIAVAQGREHEGGGAEELASPSCPASSEVGTVEVASGAGPTPLNVSGKAYLAGPYKGAPLSLVIVTPAVAGPFDLGDVVVRTALYTAPYNAQIKAVSDPIPHILQGIPLDVRSITLDLNRPDFTLNPTNCEEMHFTGSETSLLGSVAPLIQRFQVGGCRTLPFKPRLAISLKGGVKRHTFPALTATVTMPPGQANIASAQVTLPHNEQLEQAHITSQVCTQPQLAGRTCPKASIYGYAKAQTPLLDHPLEGPVYLGVGFGHKLPDLVAELNGQIRVLLHGKVDTGREDALRNTFEVVPDAPVSKFTLHMFGGRKGLIVNSENLCGRHAKNKALARFTAQSGKTVELEPTVKNSCRKGKGKHSHKKHKPGGGKHRQG